MQLVRCDRCAKDIDYSRFFRDLDRISEDYGARVVVPVLYKDNNHKVNVRTDTKDLCWDCIAEIAAFIAIKSPTNALAGK